MKETVNKKINFKFYYEGREDCTRKRSRAGTHMEVSRVKRSHLIEEEGRHNMGEVLAVRKGLTCSRTWKTSAVGASCAGVDSCKMTLNKYQGQIM